MSTDKTLADVKPGGMVRLGDGPWPEIDAILADAYSAGAEGLPFEGIARRAAVRKAVAALSAQPSPGGQDALASLPLYRLADDANGNRGLHRDDTGSWVKLQDVERALAARQPVGEPVAYLDLGAGGYMDVGTDLSDEALAELPKGRHMLGIIGTYGVDGYKPAQAVDLGQFRPAVELMEWQERGHANPDFPRGDAKKHAEALRLLALIDSHTAGGQP